VKVYMEVYGCAANQGDASIMQGILMQQGHELVDRVNKADVAVIVTCTVISTTEQRMLSKIRKLREQAKKIVVAGCMASAQPELVKKVAKDAILLPPRYIHHIADVLDGGGRFHLKPKVGVPRKIDLRLNIPIADGCIFNCSYCITKKARGNLISYPVKDIVKDVKEAIEKGCKEIRLTCQDTASYGKDIKTNLAELINEIASIERSFRIRIGMMHPLSAYKILDELLEAYENEKVYKFLHLPLQSASPRILKAMRRGYTYEMFKEIVEAFRHKFSDSTFATDIIVAFPGESEEDFEASVEAIKELKPDVTNITRFSPRPHTDAWKMERMPTQIAKERSSKLTCIANEIAYENNRKCIGKIYNALLLEEYKGCYIGKTNSYKSVFVDKGELGEFIKVKAIDATPTHLKALIIK